MVSICGYTTSRGGGPDLQTYPMLDLLKAPSHGSSQGPGDSRVLRASTQKFNDNGGKEGQAPSKRGNERRKRRRE